MNFNKIGKKSILLLVFLAFILVRVFVPSPYYFISMDEAKYLVLARNFPHHTLFNHQLYLVHPPLFPYLIHFFAQALPDYIAGITVSLLFAVITFAVTIKLFRLFGHDRFWITIALFVLVVSPLHIPTSRVVYKDSMFLGLFVLSLYCFIKGLAAPSRRCIWGAGLWGAACCLTSDLGVSLIPGFIIGYFLFKKPSTRLRDALVALLIMLAAYGGWLSIRWSVFKGNLYYPVGVDGTIEYVRNFSLRQLFTPRYFPVTQTMFNFNIELSQFRINVNIYDLDLLIKVPFFCSIAFYMFVEIVALFTIIQGLAKRRIRENPDFFFSVMLIVFALPAVLHPEPRFLIPILLPMSYLFAQGMVLVTSKVPPRVRIIPKLAWTIVVILLLVAGKHLAGAHHLIFSLKKEVESSRTAQFLKNLPLDGVMAQVGYPPELIYLTGKRVVALPVSPQVLDYFIQLYDIHYVLYGQHYLAPLSTGDGTLIWCYRTIKHIQENPDKYPLLRVVGETYQARQWPDALFIHGVRRAR